MENKSTNAEKCKFFTVFGKNQFWKNFDPQLQNFINTRCTFRNFSQHQKVLENQIISIT